MLQLLKLLKLLNYFGNTLTDQTVNSSWGSKQ